MELLHLEDGPLVSLADMVQRRIQQTPDWVAYEVRGETGWETLTWQKFGIQCQNIASNLIRLGVRKGDRCGILLSTRVEWIAIDFGILCAGGATTTIYQNSTPEECWYILDDAQVKVCFVEDAQQLKKIMSVWERLPFLEHVVVIDGVSDESRVLAYSDWVASVPDITSVTERIQDISSDDLACLIYTSGTTGTPKGVMLSHENFLRIAEAVGEQAKSFEEEKQYLFLPLAHVFGKVCELTSVYLGVPTAIDGDLERLVLSMGETRPTVMAAVPRVFEKCFNLIVRRAREAGPRKFRVFQWALSVGQKVSRHRQQGRPIPTLLNVQFLIADRLVYSKVRAVFGGQLRTCISGGAPLAVELAEFFHACGILILEGYGLTETSAVTTINQPHSFRFGSVGQAAPGVSLQLAEDGEILIRSGALMSGYFGKPEETQKVLQDAWFYSGDIGRFDEDGFLWITDRKKNLIVTSGGKNIAPQPIENKLKMSTDVISQVLVHGDRRNYLVALITVDEEAADVFLSHDVGEGSRQERLLAHVEVCVQGVNATLPRYATVKQFRIVPEEFSLERGEVTQSMKLRRANIERNYAEELSEFYRSAVESLTG